MSKGGKLDKKEIAGLVEIHEMDPATVQQRLKEKGSSFRLDIAADDLIVQGNNTDKGIRRLGKKFNVVPDRLRPWLEKKSRQRHEEIEEYLAICEAREHISSDEISLLSEIYSVKEDEILPRVRCPIKKKSARKLARVEGLDKTVEKIIQEKLRIVNRISLYDFLEVPPDTDLPILQEIAYEKESEARHSGKKNAKSTAAAALAGHCITIFKNHDNQSAYDASLFLAKMAGLDPYINVAGITGKIYPEYMNILLRQAIRAEIDISLADEYIRIYCEERGWKIEKYMIDPRKKRLVIMSVSGVALLLFLVFTISSALTTYQEIKKRAKWEDVISQVEAQPSLEGKEVILRNYVRSTEENEYTAQAQQKMGGIKKKIRARDFKDADEQSLAAIDAGELDKAHDILDQYLKRYPKTKYRKEIQARFSDISAHVDDRDFEALKSLDKESYEKRVRAYDKYLLKYPEGRHVEDVNKMIANMQEEYYKVFRKDLKACEAREDWNECIQLCEAFIKKFSETEHAETAEGMKIRFQGRIKRDKDFSDLVAKSETMGTDYEGARHVFIEYMEANPEMPSYLKRKLVAEVKKWDARIKARDDMEQAWKDALLFSRNSRNPLDKRIQRMKAFLEKHPGTDHTEDANSVLKELSHQAKLQKERELADQAVKAWKKLLRDVKKEQISLDVRIGQTQQYINKNPDSPNLKKAREILAALKYQKQVLDEQQRQQAAYSQRITQERERMKAGVRASGGRFRDNGDDTITDTQTGRMWALFDGAFASGQCLSYSQAEYYVDGLNAGGHSDWRIPTVSELEAILQNGRKFPANPASWFWSNETFWHGWNKNAHIFIKRGGSWAKESVPVAECGSVLAVR